MPNFRLLIKSAFMMLLVSPLFVLAACSTNSGISLEDRMMRAVLFHPEEIGDCLRDGQDVNELRKEGSNYSSMGKSGTFEVDRTYLALAVRHNRPEAVRELLANGADPNLTAATMGYTPLAWAARANSVEIATMLLDAGADPNLRSKTPFNDGEYAIHWAARKDNPEMMKLLLDRGADPNVTDRNGDTCLDIAETWKRQGIKHVLSQHDATEVGSPK